MKTKKKSSTKKSPLNEEILKKVIGGVEEQVSTEETSTEYAGRPYAQSSMGMDDKRKR